MLKVETLEAGAREAGVQQDVVNADTDALAFYHRSVGNMRAVFISRLHERACLYGCNQQKGKGVAGLDH